MAKPKAPAEQEALRHNPFAALAPTGSDKTASDAPPATSGHLAADASGTPTTRNPFGSEKLVVRREKKGRGGKTITRIDGLPSSSLEGLAAKMKRALGCGAKVEGDSLILLGSLVDRAAAWLRSEGASRVVEGN